MHKRKNNYLCSETQNSIKLMNTKARIALFVSAACIVFLIVKFGRQSKNSDTTVTDNAEVVESKSRTGLIRHLAQMKDDLGWTEKDLNKAIDFYKILQPGCSLHNYRHFINVYSALQYNNGDDYEIYELFKRSIKKSHYVYLNMSLDSIQVNESNMLFTKMVKSYQDWEHKLLQLYKANILIGATSRRSYPTDSMFIENTALYNFCIMVDLIHRESTLLSPDLSIMKNQPSLPDIYSYKKYLSLNHDQLETLKDYKSYEHYYEETLHDELGQISIPELAKKSIILEDESWIQLYKDITSYANKNNIKWTNDLDEALNTMRMNALFQVIYNRTIDF